jgi:hypothetical protein
MPMTSLWTRSRTVPGRCRKGNWLAILCLVAGCAPGPAPDTPAPERSASDLDYTTIPGTVYTVAPGDAHITIKVYRAGPLAALGHNHVITTAEVTGAVLVAKDPGASRADLTTSVAAWVVDDSVERARAGADFETVPSAADIEGTRANMLSARALNGALYPDVRAHLRFDGVEGDQLSLTATFSVAGGATELPLTARFTRSQDDLIIDTAFTVDQRDLGLEPFSVMAGALRVAPVVEIEVHLTAHAARASNTPRRD